jgi:protein-S-isoprenylcysteine O-methyltransferase Ste14
MYSQKKKGIQTDHIGKGKGKKGLVLMIELALKVITYLVPVVEVISIINNFSSMPVGVRGVGVVLAVLGDTVFIISVLTMRDNWRAGVAEDAKTELVTDGIYGYSRNPAFLGFDLVYIGILLLFFNAGLFEITLLVILLLHLQIVNVEEDFLLVTFGQEYLDYRKKVGRYFGRRRG